MTEKRCSKCLLIKRLDDFCRTTDKKSGRHSQCKECDKEKRVAKQMEKNLLLKQMVPIFINANKLPEENFKPIYDFEGRFWVSDYGRIVSCNLQKNTIDFLSLGIDTVGYYVTQLRMKPKSKRIRLHQLVAEHFCPRELCGQTWVNHKNGIKLDNHFENLEWVTAAGNAAHAVETGLFNLKGEKHPHHKLTASEVIEMRRLRKSGLTHKQIAKQFGICRRQAGDVINGVNWGWLVDSDSST